MTSKVKVALKKEGKREVSKVLDLDSKELANIILTANTTPARTLEAATAMAMQDLDRLRNGESLKRTGKTGLIYRFSPE